MLKSVVLTISTSNTSIYTPFGLPSSFTTISKVKQGTISGPTLCCSSVGDYPKYCLKTEKSIVIEKKNYPPIAFADDIDSITNTLAKSVILNSFAEDFQKNKRLQFNVPKCKILPTFSPLESSDIYKLSLNNKDMQIANIVT